MIPTIKIVWNSRKSSNPDLFFPFQIQYTNEHGHWLTVTCIMINSLGSICLSICLFICYVCLNQNMQSTLCSEQHKVKILSVTGQTRSGLSISVWIYLFSMQPDFFHLYCLAVCQPAVIVGQTRSSTNNCTKVAWFIIMTYDDLSVYIFLGVRSHWSEFLLKFKRNTAKILYPDFKFLIALIFFLLDAKQTRAEWWHCQQCDTALHCCCSANFMLQQA